MDRRAFFKRALHKAGETLADEAARRIASAPVNWVRPPYAQDELLFVGMCTACGDCIAACPHGVVFPLPASLGVHVAGTPALDLLNKGCHLCEDWPCVASCKTGALRLPEREMHECALPMLAAASIRTDACLPYQGPECGACAASCPVPGALYWERWRPRIEAAVCVGCALCRESCVVHPSAIQIRSRYAITNGNTESESDAA